VHVGVYVCVYVCESVVCVKERANVGVFVYGITFHTVNNCHYSLHRRFSKGFALGYGILGTVCGH
jgi:hypothetical protein